MRSLGQLGIIVWGLVLGCSSDKAKNVVLQGPFLDAGKVDSGAEEDAGTFPPDGGTLHFDAGDIPLLGEPCNGRDAYCSMRYDEFCQTATHDSAANSATYWLAPTQDQSIRNQLDNGIRALMLNVQSYNGVVTVCRGNCAEGSSPLSAVLQPMKDFMAANTREIVTLLIDTSLSASQLEAEFVSKGLDTMAHTQASNSPWPTLGEMINTGRRLVVIANTAGAGPGWLLPRANLLWETGSNWPSLIAMNCNPVVGTTSLPLGLVHHNLVEPSDGGQLGQSSVTLAAQANAFAIATTRLQTCKAQFNRAPNFIAIDFFNQGDPIGATQVMNGVRSAP